MNNMNGRTHRFRRVAALLVARLGKRCRLKPSATHESKPKSSVAAGRTDGPAVDGTVVNIRAIERQHHVPLREHAPAFDLAWTHLCCPEPVLANECVCVFLGTLYLETEEGARGGLTCCGR